MQDEDFQRRTPLVSNSRRGGKTPSQPQTNRHLYTPAHFTLSKNPHLQMEGGRPGVFSPNTIRMTDSLDKLLRDDDEDESGAAAAGDVPATPQPVKFDGNRGGGAFEPPKSSAMKRLHIPGAEVPTAGEGSLHTPKPQRVGGARYGREEAMPMHHQPHHPPPPHMNSYDPYRSNHPPMQHDPYFAPLAEDANMYHDMHSFGPIPPTVVSPLTIPEYPPYPMHAASWSPIPPEFGGNLPPGRNHWGQHPPPHGTEFHPHSAGYDHHYQHMHMPHHNQHSHYHLPGNISPFMPHYNHPMMAHAPPYQPTSAPLSPPNNDVEKQHVKTADTSPKSQGRPRKDSCASANSISSKSVGDTISPNYPRNLKSNSSEEEMNWFVPHAISGETVSRGTSQQYPTQFGPSGPPGRSNAGYIQPEKKQVKKQVKKSSLKQAKETKQTQPTYTNKSFNQKNIRSGPVSANPPQEFLESPAERAAFKVREFVLVMFSISELNSLSLTVYSFTYRCNEQSSKEFGRQFRQKESLDAARDYALACLCKTNHEIYLPQSVHWRVFLELADVAKRCNEFDNARDYYRKACKLQPLASQGWMEHSKLEEESGNLKKCANILEEGLRHCIVNENL